MGDAGDDWRPCIQGNVDDVYAVASGDVAVSVGKQKARDKLAHEREIGHFVKVKLAGVKKSVKLQEKSNRRDDGVVGGDDGGQVGKCVQEGGDFAKEMGTSVKCDDCESGIGEVADGGADIVGGDDGLVGAMRDGG